MLVEELVREEDLYSGDASSRISVLKAYQKLAEPLVPGS
jgi:hypothetical protein